jgi:acetyltransferase-like isoleucine patch superfamily enzyme
MRVDAHAVVGAGAVVTRSVDAQSTVVGVPAMALEDREAPRVRRRD